MPSGPASARRLVIRGIALVCGVALFTWTMRDLDSSRLGELLVAVGPLAVLVLVPQAVGTGFHTAAWRELLAALGHRAPLFALGGTFLGSEAARMTLPAGAAVGESVAAYGLRHRFDVPWTRGLASLAAKKAWVLCTHGVCFVLLLVVGREALGRLAASVPGGALLPWVTAATALALAVAGGGTVALLSSRRIGRAVTAFVARWPWRRPRAWAEEQQKKPEAVAAAAIPAKSHAVAAAFMFAQWVTEVAETWLILRLAGVHVTWAEALLIELGVSIVRAAAFVVPGAVGVQDASYVGLLAALGVPQATEVGATFVLLKRGKELAFAGLGLGVLALQRRREPAAPALAPAESP